MGPMKFSFHNNFKEYNNGKCLFPLSTIESKYPPINQRPSKDGFNIVFLFPFPFFFLITINIQKNSSSIHGFSMTLLPDNYKMTKPSLKAK